MVHVEISTKITELLMMRKLLVSAPHSAKYKPIKHLQDVHIVNQAITVVSFLIQLDRGWTRKVEPILKHTDRLVVKYCWPEKKNTDELT